MLKSMIEKIVSLAAPTTYEIKGKTYSSQRLVQIEPEEYFTEQIALSGLDSVCKLIRNEAPKIGRQIFVRVRDYRQVDTFSTYDDHFKRHSMYCCRADTPSVCIGSWMSQQDAIIQLRSMYMPNDDRTYLLDVLSRISQDCSTTSTDNGVTQVVEARKGVSLKTQLEIQPIVTLQPFRTFLEVAQPASQFLLRINEDGNIGLFEADGGAWKLEATRNIAAYFEEALADMISAGQVVVIR